MLYTIENENLICSIESIGAEIRSLKDKASGKEFIWQINDAIWGSSSPVLFPAIGKIKEGKVMLDGNEYAMPKHGIIRNNDNLHFEQKGNSKCIFTLESSPQTQKLYPYQFTFGVEFSLIDNRLIMRYVIENKDTVSMQFACGGHTAYACPLTEENQLSDYVIEFPESIDLNARTLADSGLLGTELRAIPSNEGTLKLSNTIFNEDALIFSAIEYDWIRLRKKNDKKGVIVRFKDYPNLALWSKPGADYVCIEPWLGLPDQEDEALDLRQKATYKTIAPDTIFSIAIETEIE